MSRADDYEHLHRPGAVSGALRIGAFAAALALVFASAANNNVVAGITAFPGATGNRFEYNSMHGNGSTPGASFPPADVRDLHAYVTGTFQNVWIGNDCDTDLPTGTICGDG